MVLKYRLEQIFSKTIISCKIIATKLFEISACYDTTVMSNDYPNILHSSVTCKNLADLVLSCCDIYMGNTEQQ